MSAETAISQDELDRLYLRLKKEAAASGYFLNPDEVFTRSLVSGLLVNQGRYGYRACPCRLADGIKTEDLDIICPCDYRDADVGQFDACYCGLYVSRRVSLGEKRINSIPERRPPPNVRKKMSEKAPVEIDKSKLSLPVWRCKVCGYLCARDEPPELCPICKADKERFERFM